VVILAPFILLLIGSLSLNDTLFLVLLLFGAWTAVQAPTFSDRFEQNRYLVSGIILAFIAPSFIITLTYGVALILAGIIIAVVIASARRVGPKSSASTT
jgi:MFS-type transporter involved in bile tolerance (Atg22 family)